MAGYYSLAISDYNGEVGTASMETGNITALSLAGTLSDITAWRSAVENIITGIPKSDTLRAYSTRISNALPADPVAQVEIKWLVTYDDITPFFDDPVNAIPNAGFGKIFNREIPTADITLLVGNSEFLDITAGAGLAFATATNQLGRSPYGGRIRVLSVQFVGRTR